MGIHRFTGCSIGGTDIRHVSFVEAFAVVKRQSEWGSKTAGMHSLSRPCGISQPMDKRVLGAVTYFNL